MEQIENFRKQLISLIENSGIPLVLLNYIVKDVYNMVNNLYLQELNKAPEPKKEEE